MNQFFSLVLLTCFHCLLAGLVCPFMAAAKNSEPKKLLTGEG